jgi:hypothetical protein
LKDAQEHAEAPKRIVRECKPSNKFPNFMEQSSNINEEATNHRFYQDVIVQDDVQDIVLGSEG